MLYFSEDDLKDYFERLDVNKDGYISKEDFNDRLEKASAHTVGPYYLEQLFSFDKSGKNEKLDFEDFRQAVRGRTRRYRFASDQENWFAGIFENTVKLETL